MSAFQISYNVSPNARDEPSNAISTVPVGSIILNSATKIPDGYLLCDGSFVSRGGYADLFAVVGTTWGAGDGTPVAFSTTSPTGFGNRVYINLTTGVGGSYYTPGTIFTMTGGASGYSGYVWTVYASVVGGQLAASATSGGVPVVFGTGTDTTPGYLTINTPTLFTLPNTSGKTIRGTAATTYTLAATGGADSKVITSANLPPHRHSFPTPGGINIISAGSTQVLGTGWNSTSIYTNASGTFQEDGTTAVADTAVDIRNSWVALQYIVRAY
jgi:microcystin-dependent protein